MRQLPRSFEGFVSLRVQSETSGCSGFILLRRRVQRPFGPLGAGRFHPANSRRNSFQRVASATLEHTVLESSNAGVYTLQIHALPTRRAGRTFSRQQQRQSACAHGCTPPSLCSGDAHENPPVKGVNERAFFPQSLTRPGAEARRDE
jgi:hypothetical protein